MSTRHGVIPVKPPLSSSYSALHKTFAVNSAFVNSNRRSVTSNGIPAAPRSFAMSDDNLAFIEKELVRDLLFIFQGIDGKFIRKKKDESYEVLADVLPPVRELTLKLCEIGHSFNKVKSFKSKPSEGLVIQGFKHGLELELHEYYRILADIKSQIQDPLFDTPVSDLRKTDMSLIKLGICVADIRARLEVLGSIADACATDSNFGNKNKFGGELCSSVFLYTEHGDPMIRSLGASLLTTIMKPLYLMLGEWILYGELEDPYNEFFIAADKDCKKEDLWHTKFSIREKMLPSFISLKQANMILAIGKNLNFLRDICHHFKGYKGREEIKGILEDTPVESLFLDDDKLLYAIERAYRTTSDMVLKVLIQDSRLVDHLNALKKYLLLGQGDFIQYLLELLQDELAKPVPKLFQHNLSSILESAIRGTNAQFEDEDILRRLDTRILHGSEKETGWDVFSLDYKTNGPIGTILTDDAIVKYNQLFNMLWRTKRIEFILSTLWKKQTTLFKHQRSMIPEIGPVLHQVQLLIQEFIHFVHQTQYYIMFEAIECAWDSLMEDVKKATDLDQVIKAHEGFLSTILSRCLLTSEKRELRNQLRAIFGNVHTLNNFLNTFDDRVSAEVITRKTSKCSPEEAQKKFFTEYVAHAKGEVERLYTMIQDLVYRFLIILNGQQDYDSITLHCLSFRLDFNEYYAQRDARLSFPLTFLSRRLSSTSVISPLLQSLNNSMTMSHSVLDSSFMPQSILRKQKIVE